MFSSPCVQLSPRQLYCSTLGGNLHCLNPVSKCSFFTGVHAQKLISVLKFESVSANFSNIKDLGNGVYRGHVES